MNRQQPHVRKLGCRCYGSSDRIRNVVEFKVHKQPEPQSREHLDSSRAFSGEQLAAYLNEPHRSSKPTRQCARKPEAVNIQGDD